MQIQILVTFTKFRIYKSPYLGLKNKSNFVSTRADEAPVIGMKYNYAVINYILMQKKNYLQTIVDLTVALTPGIMFISITIPCTSCLLRFTGSGSL